MSNTRTTRTRKAAEPKRPAKPDSDFVFEHNGEEHSLLPFGLIKAGLTRRVRNLEEVDAIFTIIEEVAEPDTLAAIDDMDQFELADFMQAWQEHSGISLGE